MKPSALFQKINIRRNAALAGGVFCLLLITLLALFCGRKGVFLPGYVRWRELRLDCGNGASLELSGKRASITREGEVLWESPEGYRVQNALCFDADRDGERELLLLAWRRGRFGISHPFWITPEDRSWSQHIFIYDLEDGENYRVRSLWGASDILVDAADWELSGDEIYITEADGDVSCWTWGERGLERTENTVTIAAFGDNLIHEPIYRYGLTKAGGNFDFLYSALRPEIRSADLAFLNLETILTGDPGAYSGYPRFGTPLQVGEAIRDAGFAGVSAATNHALDKGLAGIVDTEEFFTENDLLCLGIHGQEGESPCRILRKNGMDIAFLNYSYGTNGLSMPEGHPGAVDLLNDAEKIKAQVSEAREAADAVIVFVHWGTEYEDVPDETERHWAQLFSEWGVTAVIGTHPHVLQSPETVGDMPVFYSLGNLISAQSGAEKVLGGEARVTLQRTPEGVTVSGWELRPVVTVCRNGRYGAMTLETYRTLPGDRQMEKYPPALLERRYRQVLSPVRFRQNRSPASFQQTLHPLSFHRE